MTKEERIERAQEMLLSFGMWGLNESDTDDILFRIVAVLTTAGAVSIDWEADTAQFLLDIVDDNWSDYEKWKATAFQ
jgi:hypothetical protein